jgi:hypothetical protein
MPSARAARETSVISAPSVLAATGTRISISSSLWDPEERVLKASARMRMRSERKEEYRSKVLCKRSGARVWPARSKLFTLKAHLGRDTESAMTWISDAQAAHRGGTNHHWLVFYVVAQQSESGVRFVSHLLEKRVVEKSEERAEGQRREA